MCESLVNPASGNRCLVRAVHVFMAAAVLGGLSAAAASASYPILMLDFSNNNTAAQTEPGFASFTVGDSGKVVDGVKVEIAPTATGGALDARWRGAPAGIPYERIYRDFVFSRPGGMRVTLSGLNPNETYEITIYAYDTSSSAGGDRIADWLANGDFCLTAGFSAAVAPVDANSEAHTGMAVTDGNGRLVLEATPNPSTTEQSGANNPYGFLNALVVSSLTPITQARRPVPAPGATIGATALELQWEPGMLAKSSNVYLGEDPNAVAQATPQDTDLFRGNTTGASFPVGSAGNPYPDGLPTSKTYYWRIDGVDASHPDSPWKGEVWSFTVAPLIASAP
nr:hypothetical protein [Phycisphaerae bacterium]